MRYLLLAPVMGLAACATTGAGLGRTDVEDVLASTKAPAEVAQCASSRLAGRPRVRDGENRSYWLARNNGYGVPVTRWDFIPVGNGTRVERRTTIGFVNSGAGDIRSCL